MTYKIVPATMNVLYRFVYLMANETRMDVMVEVKVNVWTMRPAEVRGRS